MTNTTNSSSFPNMNVPEFVSITCNPMDLRIHTLLTEMGYNNTPDAFFIETSKLFNFYDSPVIDMENNVITHAPDVLAAIENEVASMNVYQVNMTSAQLRIFIALKHKYHSRNLIASFKTIKFYEEYLATNPEGIRLSASLTGTTREKIAMLMQTSDSTIKRIKLVGEEALDKLGLIEQGFTSFKQVADQIKADRLAAETAKRKAAITTLVEPTPADEYYIEPNTNPGEKKEPTPSEEYYVADPTKNDTIVGNPNIGNEPYYSDGVNNVETIKPTEPRFEDFNCMFSSEGLGQFEINVSDNVPTVTINGKEIKNMSYEPIVDSGNANGTTHSFVLSQPGKNPLCIQLTIENLSKAA